MIVISFLHDIICLGFVKDLRRFYTPKTYVTINQNDHEQVLSSTNTSVSQIYLEQASISTKSSLNFRGFTLFILHLPD